MEKAITILEVKKTKISDELIEKYYYIVSSIYFASMFISSIRPGVMSTLLMVLIVSIRILEKQEIKRRITLLSGLVALYALWCGISLIWFDTRVGINAYFEAFSNSLLPVIFAFFIVPQNNKIWISVLRNYLIVGIIGTFLLITQPTWFVKFCLSRGFDYRRLSFAFGSIVMGTMGAVAVLIALRQIVSSKGKRGKIQYLLTCLFAFLSMQRSAWIVVIVTLVLAHYYIFFRYKVVKKRFILFELIGLAVLFVVFGKQIMGVLGSWLTVRQNQYGGNITVANTISERSNQWLRGIANSNWIIGSGFGSRGHKAAASGFTNYVADGNWILVLCETGIIGLLLFAIICGSSLIQGMQRFKKLFLPFGIIITFMFQAIGSNVFEQQLIAPLFWLAVGEVMRSKSNQNQEFL